MYFHTHRQQCAEYALFRAKSGSIGASGIQGIGFHTVGSWAARTAAGIGLDKRSAE